MTTRFGTVEIRHRERRLCIQHKGLLYAANTGGGAGIGTTKEHGVHGATKLVLQRNAQRISMILQFLQTVGIIHVQNLTGVMALTVIKAA